MPPTQLPVLPLPMLTALVCAALVGAILWRLDLGPRRATWVFAALFAVFAVQSFLVGLRFGYGVERFRPLQGGLSLLTGPLMYLGFAALADSGAGFWRQAGMIAAAMAALAGVAFGVPGAGAMLDLGITLSYMVFAIALLALWRRGPDALTAARLSVARDIHHWLIWGAGQLLALAVIDSAIALSFALGRGDLAVTIIAYASAVTLPFLLLVFVALPRHLTATRPAPAPARSDPDHDPQKIEAAARALILGAQLYLDPDLSVQRIARRLHIPARVLSAAVNQTQGENISSYINRFRLDHAAGLLRETDASVIDIAQASGFLSRSNFYREFQRVQGLTPAAYRAAHRAD